MSLVTGSASASTGLSGRIRTWVDTNFSTFVRDYTTGSVGQKGLDAMAQGMIDAFNNDKLGPGQLDQSDSAYYGGQITF